MKLLIFPLRGSNSKCNFLFFNFKLVTRSETFLFQLRVSNSKFNLIFYEVELVTRKKNFCKNVRVSNSKCDVILHNSVSYLDFITREFQTSI